ncbi:MAG TPA: hypothetical protein VHF89_05130 [Solirubrobacteraceae bacterium]|nr:hypothetical protein [Solirubrobacteraceae bacterium]
MPDRAIIPLLPALALGFICGIVASTLLLEDTPTLLVGLAGAVVTALAAGSSIFGVPGDSGEKAIVAALRVACAVGLFVCVYLFMIGFLRDQNMVALIWLPLAGVFGLLISRLRVRDRGEVRSGTEEPA